MKRLTDPQPLISKEQAEADREAFMAAGREWAANAYERLNENAKLTFADVCDIRDRVFIKGERQVDLAKEYGISTGQMSKIVSGKSWT